MIFRCTERRKREDTILLAHIRAAYYESNEIYGSPRMTHELGGKGVGCRRVARLMCINNLKARIKCRFKKTTESRLCFHEASPT